MPVTDVQPPQVLPPALLVSCICRRGLCCCCLALQQTLLRAAQLPGLACNCSALPLDAGAGLRAAFACDAGSLSGFGGLVMRLRGEGHDQLHVVGPTGEPACLWATCLCLMGCALQA